MALKNKDTGMSPAIELNLQEPADLECGRVLFEQPCNFVIGCVKLDQVPTGPMPEIAFAGRSNVGKSSILNALVRQNALARTSNTPGRTREINFFNLGERLMLADLPGYGYARVSKAQVQQWTGLVESYLKGRANLRRVCVLIDSRHGLKESDRGVMAILDKVAQPYQVVLTKVDKVKADYLGELVSSIKIEISKKPASFPVIALTSSRKGTGIEELRASLATLTGS
jgi:GTP-binding protein